MRISEDDPSSFNRFADAIQETETVLLRVSDLVVLLGAHAPTPELRFSSLTPPPVDIYL